MILTAQNFCWNYAALYTHHMHFLDISVWFVYCSLQSSSYLLQRWSLVPFRSVSMYFIKVLLSSCAFIKRASESDSCDCFGTPAEEVAYSLLRNFLDCSCLLLCIASPDSWTAWGHSTATSLLIAFVRNLGAGIR